MFKISTVFMGALLALAASSASGATIYEVTSTSLLGTLDTATGAFSQIGNLGSQLAGLAVSGSTYYGGLNFGTSLYRVDVSNANLTLIGSGASKYTAIGSTLSGLYGLDDNLNLFSVNPSTGATTLLGSTGLSISTPTYGLSTNTSTLYMTYSNNLYTLNTLTGAPTLVGALGTTNRIGAMVFTGGTLFGGDNQNSKIDTINTSTGAATLGPNETPATVFYGLAPQLASSTPEPGTLSLLAAGIATLSIARRRRMK